MREIPIGIQDFKAIRDNDGYFVDKSALIDSIITSIGEHGSMPIMPDPRCITINVWTHGNLDIKRGSRRQGSEP